MTYRRWFSIFAAVLLATAFVLAAGLFYAIKIVRQPGYPASIYDPAALMQDNAFRWHDRSCEVLIYGDSTANVGLDPRIVTARTGLTACNIATSRPVVDDLGTLPLDAFLAHNPAPRLIVLQFGPETFYRSRLPWENTGPFTPMLMLARDLPTAFALRKMLRHPAETTQFLSFILQTRYFPHKVNVPYFIGEFNRMIAYSDASNGRLDLSQPGESTCSPAPPLNGPLDTAWLRELHRQYESRGIHVLIRAAPIPVCDPQLALFQRDLASYVDGNVDPLPVADFIAGSRHTTTKGSIPDTLGLVALIESRRSKMLPNAR